MRCRVGQRSYLRQGDGSHRLRRRLFRLFRGFPVPCLAMGHSRPGGVPGLGALAVRDGETRPQAVGTDLTGDHLAPLCRALGLTSPSWPSVPTRTNLDAVGHLNKARNPQPPWSGVSLL